jgi:hypothetical protein
MSDTPVALTTQQTSHRTVTYLIYHYGNVDFKQSDILFSVNLSVGIKPPGLQHLFDAQPGGPLHLMSLRGVNAWIRTFRGDVVSIQRMISGLFSYAGVCMEIGRNTTEAHRVRIGGDHGTYGHEADVHTRAVTVCISGKAITNNIWHSAVRDERNFVGLAPPTDAQTFIPGGTRLWLRLRRFIDEKQRNEHKLRLFMSVLFELASTSKSRIRPWKPDEGALTSTCRIMTDMGDIADATILPPRPESMRAQSIEDQIIAYFWPAITTPEMARALVTPDMRRTHLVIIADAAEHCHFRHSWFRNSCEAVAAHTQFWPMTNLYIPVSGVRGVNYDVYIGRAHGAEYDKYTMGTHDGDDSMDVDDDGSARGEMHRVSSIQVIL